MSAKHILIVDAHPDKDPARYCHALAAAYAAGAKASGREVRQISLSQGEFPLLRSAAEFERAPDNAFILKARDDIQWADHIVFVFPLWVGAAPALLRAFLEQAARAGFFAEAGDKGLHLHLKGKSARLIVTMGMPALAYRLIFRAHGVKAIMQSALGFSGARPVRLTLFGGMGTASESLQKKRLAQIEALGARAI